MNNKHIIIFNKVSKVFYCIVSGNATEFIDNSRFITKEVEFDEDEYTWDGGDFDNGKIINKKDVKPKVYERDVNNLCSTGINGFYPQYKQLNAIMGVLNDLIETQELQGECIDEFKKMYDFISKRRLMNERYKKAYMNNPQWDYISTKEQNDNTYKRLDGGLFEEFNKADF